MTSITLLIRKTLLVFALVFLTTFNLMASGRDSITLAIGDKAPLLNYGHWLKGTPVKEYQKGRLYLVEFWATWCGPCIQMMPHLSKVARERGKEITIIGCNIWEGSHDSKGKPYDSYLPRITKFVKSMGKNMDYNVITDNNAQYMASHWMVAAGQGGIPCSFMIKDGTILWIGHPYKLDSVLNVVQSGKYDIAAEKKRIEDERAAEANGPMKEFSANYTRFDKLVKGQEYEKALRLIDSCYDNAVKEVKGSYGFFKFQLLLEHFGEEKAMAFCRPWQAAKLGYRLSTAAIIGSKNGLSKSTYEYAMDIWKQGDGYNDKDGHYSPMTKTYMANLYAKMNDFKQAIELQEAAIEEGKQALKENKYPGQILDTTIDKWQAQLKKYQNGDNKSDDKE